MKTLFKIITTMICISFVVPALFFAYRLIYFSIPTDNTLVISALLGSLISSVLLLMAFLD